MASDRFRRDVTRRTLDCSSRPSRDLEADALGAGANKLRIRRQSQVAAPGAHVPFAIILAHHYFVPEANPSADDESADVAHDRDRVTGNHREGNVHQANRDSVGASVRGRTNGAPASCSGRIRVRCPKDGPASEDAAQLWHQCAHACWGVFLSS